MRSDADTLRAIEFAFNQLGGEQSVEAVRDWIEIHAPQDFDERRIGTLLRGYSINLPLARDRHPEFGKPFLRQTKRGFFSLV